VNNSLLGGMLRFYARESCLWSSCYKFVMLLFRVVNMTLMFMKISLLHNIMW